METLNKVREREKVSISNLVRERKREMDVHMPGIGSAVAGRNRDVRNPKTLTRERMQEMENHPKSLSGERDGGMKNPSVLVGERGEEMESPKSLLGDEKEALGNSDSLAGERNREIGSSKNVVREGKVENPTSLVVREKKRDTDTPPVDDCCPICFESFTIAVKTSCGHWFCEILRAPASGKKLLLNSQVGHDVLPIDKNEGNCILQYWNYSAAPALQRCKCPICTCLISKLTPAASLTLQQEEEVIKVLKNVGSYNHLFVGGVHGFGLKVLQLPPLVMKRMFLGLMDPSLFRFNYYLMRHLALLLSALYEICNFDFIPMGRGETRRLFDYCAIALVIVLCLAGICRRQLLRRRVRLLAAAEQ